MLKLASSWVVTSYPNSSFSTFIAGSLALSLFGSAIFMWHICSFGLCILPSPIIIPSSHITCSFGSSGVFSLLRCLFFMYGSSFGKYLLQFVSSGNFLGTAIKSPLFSSSRDFHSCFQEGPFWLSAFPLFVRARNLWLAVAFKVLPAARNSNTSFFPL